MRFHVSTSAKPTVTHGRTFLPSVRSSHPCRNWLPRTCRSAHLRASWSGFSSLIPRSKSESWPPKPGPAAASRPAEEASKKSKCRLFGPWSNCLCPGELIYETSSGPYPVPVDLPGRRQSGVVPHRSRHARVVSKPPQTPGHSSWCRLRSSLDGALHPDGYFCVDGVEGIWLARWPLGDPVVFRATGFEHGVVGNLFRRAHARRGVRGDSDSLAGNTLQHRRLPLAYPSSGDAACPIPVVGHLRQLPQLWHMVAQPQVGVSRGQPTARQTMLS